MSKDRFEYTIRGYRYASESFQIFKGLPVQKKKEVHLSAEQRQRMGYLCITKGGKAALDYVKHIERERKQEQQWYKTYGFVLKDNPHEYVYIPNLRCSESAALQERLYILRQIREYLAREEGRVKQCTECDLDGKYRPVNIRNNYMIANLERPVVVWLHVMKEDESE